MSKLSLNITVLEGSTDDLFLCNLLLSTFEYWHGGRKSPPETNRCAARLSESRVGIYSKDHKDYEKYLNTKLKNTMKARKRCIGKMHNCPND